MKILSLMLPNDLAAAILDRRNVGVYIRRDDQVEIDETRIGAQLIGIERSPKPGCLSVTFETTRNEQLGVRAGQYSANFDEGWHAEAPHEMFG